MPAEIIPCIQGSPEWEQLRCGLLTASDFHKVMSNGKKTGSVGLPFYTHLDEIAAERISGRIERAYSRNFERGHAQEIEARDDYEFITDSAVQQVGFVKNHGVGCSPDGFIGDDGVIEIKSVIGRLMVEYRRKQVFPDAYKAQCQGVLWITEREWVDLVVYSPGHQIATWRARRDEGYIARIAARVAKFHEELDRLLEGIKRTERAPTLGAQLAQSLEGEPA